MAEVTLSPAVKECLLLLEQPYPTDQALLRVVRDVLRRMLAQEGFWGLAPDPAGQAQAPVPPHVPVDATAMREAVVRERVAQDAVAREANERAAETQRQAQREAQVRATQEQAAAERATQVQHDAAAEAKEADAKPTPEEEPTRRRRA
jgi:hypothetical protein